MKKTKRNISIAIISLLVVFLLLWIQELNGYILNIQGYFGLRWTLVVFWAFIALVFIRTMISDTGFLKLGSVLGVFTCGLILIVNYSIKDYNYEIVKSEEYHIVIEKVEENSSIVFNVYQRKNFLFSEYIDSINVHDYYEITYEFIDNRFIVTKCGVATCRSEEIILD